MSYLERRLRAYYRYDVKAVRRIKPVFRKICQRGFHKVLLLAHIHGKFSRRELLVAPRLDFHEDNFAKPLGNDVHFEVPAVPVALQDAVVALGEIGASLPLAEYAKLIMLCHDALTLFLEKIFH